MPQGFEGGGQVYPTFGLRRFDERATRDVEEFRAHSGFLAELADGLEVVGSARWLAPGVSGRIG